MNLINKFKKQFKEIFGDKKIEDQIFKNYIKNAREKGEL